MITINKGLDLPIQGDPKQEIVDASVVTRVAVLGEDYVGMRPTMKVRIGDVVSQGQTLFEDKKNPGVVFTAPCAGVIQDINRGAQRVLQSVVIEKQEGDNQARERQSQPACVLLANGPGQQKQAEGQRNDVGP